MHPYLWYIDGRYACNRLVGMLEPEADRAIALPESPRQTVLACCSHQIQSLAVSGPARRLSRRAIYQPNLRLLVSFLGAPAIISRTHPVSRVLKHGLACATSSHTLPLMLFGYPPSHIVIHPGDSRSADQRSRFLIRPCCNSCFPSASACLATHTPPVPSLSPAPVTMTLCSTRQSTQAPVQAAWPIRQPQTKVSCPSAQSECYNNKSRLPALAR